MTAVAIIPARGGSRRIPRKNIREFHGKPIIAYSIEAARRSGLFDHIVVSTEDSEIAEVADSLGVWVAYRPLRLAHDSIGTQEVIAQTVGLFDSEFVCCIYATAALLKSHDLVRGLRALEQNRAAAFAFSVGIDPLQDAGQFYWGQRHAFSKRVDLISERSIMIPIESKRVIDINTEEDWKVAEQKYENLAPWEKNL